MIRRGFWLTVGVVLGVTGYRRLTRIARMLTDPRTAGMPGLPGTSPTAGPQMLAPRARARSSVARAAAAARFVRDVREGMAEYRDLHRENPDPDPRGRTLEGRTLEAPGYPASSSDPAGSDVSQQGRREP